VANNLVSLKNIASAFAPASIASDINRSPSNKILPEAFLALLDFTF
jgi:hypothetical protein